MRRMELLPTHAGERQVIVDTRDDANTDGFWIAYDKDDGGYTAHIRRNSVTTELTVTDTPVVGTKDKLLLTLSSTDGVTFELDGSTATTNATATPFSATLRTDAVFGAQRGAASYADGVISAMKWRSGTNMTLAEIESQC